MVRGIGTVIEEGTNFPSVLGLKNRPWSIIRTTGIGRQASALVGGETPVHLAQKLIGQSHITGPSQLPAILTIDLFPQIKRPTPLRDLLKGRGLRAQENNIPAPYVRPRLWPTGNIARAPSVTGIISGPARTMHASVEM